MVISIFSLQEAKVAMAAWEGGDAHYNFAIYAAGRAYVPDIVDNLLCQVRQTVKHTDTSLLLLSAMNQCIHHHSTLFN